MRGPQSARIHDELPDAKLVAILRDPVDRAYSNWAHLWADGLEPLGEFMAARDDESRSHDDPVSAFSFPNPVNEVAARVVAGGVVVMALLVLVLDRDWVLVLLAYGFVARVLAGPRFSPLGLFATRILVPRLPVAEKLVPGPPKRFAQGIGAVISVAALVLRFGFGLDLASDVLLVLLLFAATLESVFALCVGCKLFGLLMRFGVIPESVCAECADIGLRRAS